MNEIEMLKERIASMESGVKVLPCDDRFADTIGGKINTAMDAARAIHIKTLAMIGFITGKKPDANDPCGPECLEDAVNTTLDLLHGSIDNLDVIMQHLGV